MAVRSMRWLGGDMQSLCTADWARPGFFL